MSTLESLDEELESKVPEMIDPEIWSLLFAVRKADVCFVAVLALLAKHHNPKSWLGLQLADIFREGQRDSVRTLASLVENSESRRALEIVQDSKIDWMGRFERAPMRRE